MAQTFENGDNYGDIRDKLNANAEEINTLAQSSGYKVYSALITQTGTSAPTAKVLKNTTGTTISFARNSEGTYGMTGGANVFTTDKTAIMCSFNSGGAYANGTMLTYGLGAQFFIIESRNSGTLSDGMLVDAFVEIRIYP